MPRYDPRDAFNLIRQNRINSELNPARRTLPFATVSDGGVTHVAQGGNIVLEGGSVDVSDGMLILGSGVIEGSWLAQQVTAGYSTWTGTLSSNDTTWQDVASGTVTAPAWATQTMVMVNASGTASTGVQLRLRVGSVTTPWIDGAELNPGDDNGVGWSLSAEYGGATTSIDVAVQAATASVFSGQSQSVTATIQTVNIYIRGA